MSLRDEIEERLKAEFHPEAIEVVDESEAHRGHAGWREGGQTHFRVRMRAAGLAPLSRVGRHRAIHAALGPDVMGRLHALALEIG